MFRGWRRLRCLGVLAVSVVLSACGYALVGRGTTVDPSIKRIGVPLFRDLSGKPGLDQEITQKVTEELLKRGRFDVVPEAEGTDATVVGEILSVQSTPVAFSEAAAAGEGEQPPVAVQTQASRYAVVVTARVTYAKQGAPEPIWSSDSFTAREEYDVGDDPAAFFDREEQALQRLSTTFARNLVAAMLEAF